MSPAPAKSSVVESIQSSSPQERQQFVVRSFTDNYDSLIANDAKAWRGKFRKMSQSAIAFYRGSAALYYADLSRDNDPFVNRQNSRVWIQGDLHAENFGTYMNGAGVLVFDVNDFDEAYVGPFNWDVKRFITGLGLIGYDKALSDAEIREVMRHAARSYAQQVARFSAGLDDDFTLTLGNTDGKLREVLMSARLLTRVGLLDRDTEIVDGDRRFRSRPEDRLDEATRASIESALADYYLTIPPKKRRSMAAHAVKDSVRRRGMGIGSAGLLLYSVLLEGETQALENDIIISIKHSQPAAPARFIDDPEIKAYFKHDGHRTAISQRALQAHADPLLGHATMDGRGMYVSEVSPYTADLDWDDINDVDDILQVVGYLGRCVAKIHCISDSDSDQTLIDYSTEDAIHGVLGGNEPDYADYMANFGEQYAAIVRSDHRLFVDAFRNHQVPGV